MRRVAISLAGLAFVAACAVENPTPIRGVARRRRANRPDLAVTILATRIRTVGPRQEIFVSDIGFGWGGWVLGSTSQKNADLLITEALVARLAPMCLGQFNLDVQKETNLKNLQEKNTIIYDIL